MAIIELIFRRPLAGGSPNELVFGNEDDSGSGQDAVARAAIRLPGARVGIRALRRKTAATAIRLPGARVALGAIYQTRTDRPAVGGALSAFQEAAAARGVLVSVYQQSAVASSTTRIGGGQAMAAGAATVHRWQDSQRLRLDTRQGMGNALAVAGITAQAWQEAIRVHLAARQGMDNALAAQAAVLQRFQEAIRVRRATVQAFSDGLQRGTWHTSSMGDALQLAVVMGGARYQDAMVPPPGITPGRPVDPPKPPPCYVPPPGGAVELVFSQAWTGSTELVFFCCKGGVNPEPTVVVPVKEVYLTINSALLIRLDNGRIIPATSLNMSLDVDSWTWQFSAAVPGQALADVQPNSDGDPVVVQATINGTPFNFALERIARDRTFGSSQLRVSGRGLGAELDAPYAPEMSFGNEFPRTARQLVEDILTLNGVPIGWSVAAWNLTDWLVPAGVFNHSGSYISAVNAVVGAAGAYVQPHNTDRSLLMHLRYPAPAWEWDSVTPNFELPAAVTSQESFEWTEKPRYNRAFVIGQEHGVHGRYTRSGTAGDLPAPTVVDPLITHADAVRQRGRAILSDTGRIATVALRLPVLAETGIIKPGNFVRYVEGSNTHIGLSRGVSVDVSMPTIYQTLTLETHVEPV